MVLGVAAKPKPSVAFSTADHADGPFDFVLRYTSASSPIQARQSTTPSLIWRGAVTAHNHVSSSPGFPLIALWNWSSFLCNKRKPRRVPDVLACTNSMRASQSATVPGHCGLNFGGYNVALLKTLQHGLHNSS